MKQTYKVSVVFGMALLAILPACSVQPLYRVQDTSEVGYSSNAQASLASIEVARIPDRAGQLLKDLLEDRFYSSGQRRPEYTLNITLTQRDINTAINNFGDATRQELRTQAKLVLVDYSTGEAVFRTSLRSLSTYDELDTEFATEVASRDALERNMRILTDDTTALLAAYFQKNSSDAVE